MRMARRSGFIRVILQCIYGGRAGGSDDGASEAVPRARERGYKERIMFGIGGR